MGHLPILPNELWLQILSYVITPTHPVAIEGWEGSKPLLEFNPADANVQRSLGLLTGPTSSAFFFPVSIPDIWQQFISRTTWSLDRGPWEIREIIYEDWPHLHRHLWAKDLGMLQKTFAAQVKHVEVIADQDSYFQDGELDDSKIDRALPGPQWASAMTDTVDAVLATCSSLRSLRFYLDINEDIHGEFEHYYLSDEFRDIWDCTRPSRHWWPGPVADWKEECKRRGVEFRIVARMSESREEDDLEVFWDLEECILREFYNDADGFLICAVEAHAVRKEEGRVAKVRAGA